MGTPFLSIIVPIYNIEQYLEQCLDSILHQTWQDYELILVDDGSTDCSGQICDTYRARDKRIQVIHKQNQGLVAARKSGIEIAKGKYIGYVDGDDFIKADFYETLCRHAQQEAVDIAIADVFFYQNRLETPIKQHCRGGLYCREELEQTIYPYLFSVKEYFDFMLLPAVWNKIYRRELLVKWQRRVDDRISLGEDTACSLFALLDADSMYYCKDYYGYAYRINTDSMTHTRRKVEPIILQQEYCWKQLHQFKEQAYTKPMLRSFLRYSAYMYGNHIMGLIESLSMYQWKNETELKQIGTDSVFQEMHGNMEELNLPRYLRYAFEMTAVPNFKNRITLAAYLKYSSIRESKRK